MIMLGTRDVQKSIPFYRDLLGLKLAQQFGGFAMFQSGNITIVLSEDCARSAEHVVGATEVVFSVDDIQASYEALKNQGVRFEREPVPIAGPMWAAHLRSRWSSALDLRSQADSPLSQITSIKTFA